MNLIQMLMNIGKRAKKKINIPRGPDRRIGDRREDFISDRDPGDEHKETKKVWLHDMKDKKKKSKVKK